MPIESQIDSQIVRELAPHGRLRVGVNMANALLVTGRAENGDPAGVSPDMGRAIADRLGVPVEYVPYPSPGLVADGVEAHEWDIANIGAEPQRAEKISFTPAYAEIEATYLVAEGSSIRTPEEADRPGHRIAYKARSAYGLWLERNISEAELVAVPPDEDALAYFLEHRLEVLAGLRPRLTRDVETLSGYRMLDGQFMSVQQAIGTARENTVAAAWLTEFVQEAKACGVVAGFIERHGVKGLTVPV
ncbi:transporter substrate-binding domain-containing protein [Roseibium aggregatum]|uniref:Transporter substrate-binding domain-containing protein n=1 Tax=Roseibium aggregatum TaxID=187304 RepID=A0A926P285_9HYPH|nr:transporter substrate-binding domain-containing protein [Roseibium aggregatum]MBD1548686.1 transporter substrate-binding domain-containing protein [Roseibium aggregatum]